MNLNKIWIAALALAAAPWCAAQEPYPARPVRLVVTAAPGGVVDITARIIGQQLSEQLGRNFVIDNRTGAGGIIGSRFVSKATPDGYTLMLATPGFTIVPTLHKSLPYDPIKDFSAITQVTSATQVLVVSAQLQAHTLKEFVALARSNPGRYNYGSGGLGSPLHVYGELFSRAAQVKLVHVAFKGGGGESMAALLAGEIHMLFAAIPTAASLIKAGKVRALAVTTDGRRLASLPDVPSMSEMGLPGMTINAMYGLIGPAGIPRPIVDKLRSEVVKALAVPAVRERYAAQDAEVVGSTPEEYRERLLMEFRRWTEIVQAAGISIDAPPAK